MMNGPGIFMMLFWIILLGLLIYWLYRLFTNKTKKTNNQTQQGDEAINILKEKFARGEISEEEYERRKNILTKD